MGIPEIEQDLKLIRKVMESASRYTNIPASGYMVTGLLGVFGAWKTWLFLEEKDFSAVLGRSELWEVRGLAMTWLAILFLAVAIIVIFSWRKARKYQVTAWNSLAARMILSQVPLAIVAGVLTVAMGLKGYYDLIPSVWLGIYGAILYSFSYFTGVEHKVEGSVFILLGIVAAFSSIQTLPLLLGLGFGGVHLMAGVVRAFLEKKGTHVSEPVE